VELDPLATAPLNNLARILWYEGKLDEADATARKAVEVQPNSASSRRWQVLIAAKRGDGETALRQAQLEPDEGYRRFELAVAQHARGDQTAADAALDDLIAHSRGMDYQVAQVCAVRGNKEKAFHWLQIAFEHHDTGLLGLLVDPLLRELRADPRYEMLIAKMNFPPAL
jgi:tetratricopeptide (TPR) repeat protein